MTFNSAFPSSPLSRSAFQGDAELRVAGGVNTQQRHLSLTPSPDLEGASSSWTRGQMSAIRGGGSTLLSPIQSNTSLHSSLLSTSPRYPPPNRSPDSIASRSIATSPVSNVRLSPVFRSSPTSATRRRFSEQSFGSGKKSPGPNFGSLVGSYEESLLSGRMSSLPSKPLIFDAELGVLGLGKCKASLKCPPHVTFKFPAHFYSLDKQLDKESTPSHGTPYVGTIEVEGHYVDALLESGPLPLQDAPVFPGYRIPPKGQIQLIIKNPNMTAVKLFLVPYDFTDMPAGTKTFIRQKSHVASPGPGIESTHRSSEQQNVNAGRETLRYAVHLHFCAVPSIRRAKWRQSEPGFTAGGLDRLNHRRKSEESGSKSKKQAVSIYLHRQIRVVFDARVPDRSEKLRVVTDTPAGSDENRQNIYSTYPGPSEDWNEAKRIRRADISAAREAQLDMVERTMLPGEESSSFYDGVINSDPNGEKWFGDSGTPGDYDAMDIPLTSRSPWREPPEEEVNLPMGDYTCISAPSNVISFPSAAFNEIGSGKRAFSTSVSAAIEHSTSKEEETKDEDRALLEQWHASLHLRTQSVRSPSPVTPTPTNTNSVRASKHTTPSFNAAATAKRTISPTNGFFSIMNTSTTSIGSNSSSADTAHSSHRHKTSSSAVTRSSNKAVDSQAAPHGPSLPRPVQASLDLDSANGVLEPSFAAAAASAHGIKPSLIRQWSLQAQTSATSSGRASPA